MMTDARYAARLLWVFGAGMALTWALTAAAFSNLLPLAALGVSLTVVQLAVNLVTAGAAFLITRARKDLSGVAVLQLIIALVVSFVEISVDATHTWYFAVGLLIWAFTLKDLWMALGASAAVAVAAFVLAVPTQLRVLPLVIAVAAGVVILAGVARRLTAPRSAPQA
ncbi:hypothetical protein [Zhihengliuella flava]|uniref:Uncharacterized protein n=1 Tax=Zhihengliuella flava TaxID=1285193 RepID=A0A931DBV2_9MICC|nr:hypothetical protein [Zhihengliuella flava]MBG6084566.1 hypothetical protein [Zhihengliuella flava]